MGLFSPNGVCTYTIYTFQHAPRREAAIEGPHGLPNTEFCMYDRRTWPQPRFGEEIFSCLDILSCSKLLTQFWTDKLQQLQQN